jgi:Replication factor-A C terminal domain/Replication protein A OB domain
MLAHIQEIISTKKKDSYVSLYAIVQNVSNVKEGTSATTGKPFKNATVELIDSSSKRSISVVFWGGKADVCSKDWVGHMVHVQNFKVTEYNNIKQLSLDYKNEGTFLLDPPFDPHPLYQLCKDFSNSVTLKERLENKLNQKAASVECVKNVKILPLLEQDLRLQQLFFVEESEGLDRDEEQCKIELQTEQTVQIVATIFIRQMTMDNKMNTYLGCTNKSCVGKTVTINSDGLYYCSNCQLEHEDACPFYKLVLDIKDETGSLRVTLFNNVVETLLGRSAIEQEQEISKCKGSDAKLFKLQSFYDFLHGQTCIFTIQIKTDFDRQYNANGYNSNKVGGSTVEIYRNDIQKTSKKQYIVKKVEPFF